MRKGKCKSVGRTDELSPISRGEENQGTKLGSEKRGSRTELRGEETGAAKPDVLKVAGLIVIQLSLL